MSAFIARQIETACDKSEDAGKAKYRAYFINTKIYEKWRAEVETILRVDGYESVIVTE